MKNDSHINSSVTTADSQAFLGLLSSVGYTNKFVIKESRSGIMKGHFFHNELVSGLSIHGGDVVEASNAISSTQLPASLSLNILLNGQINFCLGNKAYQLNSSNISPAKTAITATCALGVLAKSDLLSRKINSGQAVKKVNLFIKRTWLEKRCSDAASKVLIKKVFSNHGALYQWQDNADFSYLAQQLLDCPPQSSLQIDLLKEQIAFTLLNKLLAILASKIEHPQQPIAEGVQWIKAEQKQLKKKENIDRYIEQEIENTITLPSISKHFGLSISSLQRYFKQTYNLTINEYIRQQRLDKAKIAITIKEFSISEAAFQAGYNHVSNFTSAFKKQFGITPANLLKLHQLNRVMDKNIN